MPDNDFTDTFRNLFDTYYVPLRNFARRFGNLDDESDDIVEDVFLELWQNRERLDFNAGIVSYLFRSTSSHALNTLKRKNISPLRIELLDSINNARIDYISSIEGSKIIESHDFRKHIEAAINSLPEKCGEAFRLKYLYGMTNTDIAKAMNISVRTAEGHTYKALKELRRKLSHLLIILIFLHLTT